MSGRAGDVASAFAFSSGTANRDPAGRARAAKAWLGGSTRNVHLVIANNVAVVVVSKKSRRRRRTQRSSQQILQAKCCVASASVASKRIGSSLRMASSRPYLIGGNWKANGTVASVEKLVAEFNAAGPIPPNTDVVIGAPFIHIPMLLNTLRPDIKVAAQNSALTGTGAHTGEVCASQLKDLGLEWVILGHSERREGFGMAGEDSKLVADKTKLAIDEGLKVMFCIGEKKEEREAGTTMDVCAEQMAPLAEILSEDEWANVSIAYEPVWAIGTGLTATPEMAQETHANIRQWVAANVSQKVADAVQIQYGGSMNGGNAKALLAENDIDGGLIGGASLKLEFFDVINGAGAPVAA